MSDRPDDDHDEAEDEALAERLRRARLGGDLFDDLDRVADDVPDESVGDDPDDDDVADADAEVDGEDDPTAVPSADDDADDTADGGADEGDTADAGEAAEGAPARFRAFNVKLDPDDDHVEDDLGAAATVPSARAASRAAASGSNGRSGLLGRVTRRLRGGGVVAAALLLIVGLAAVPLVRGTLEKTPRDKWGISYGGGPFEGEHFQRIVAPGSNLFFNGIGDSLFLYPADQRNYIVSGDGDDDAAAANASGSTVDRSAISAPTSDRVQVSYQVAVYFKLNIDRLQQFHEELGLRYNAFTPSGWDRMIQDNFRQQIENALQEQTRRQEVAELFGNVEVLLELQDEVESTLSERLAGALGGDYFCSPRYQPGEECGNPTFQIKRIDLPLSVQAAFEDVRTSAITVDARTAEALAIERLASALQQAGDQYVLLRAVESGKVSFWVIPSDNGLTLTTPPGDTATPDAEPSTPTTTEGG